MVTSLLVTYSSTTDCKVKLPTRCPRSMSERRRRPSTASNTCTCESLATSTASSSSRLTGASRRSLRPAEACQGPEAGRFPRRGRQRERLVPRPRLARQRPGIALEACPHVACPLPPPQEHLQVVEPQRHPPSAQLLHQ